MWQGASIGALLAAGGYAIWALTDAYRTAALDAEALEAQPQDAPSAP